MGPRALNAPGAKTIPNFMIIRRNQCSTTCAQVVYVRFVLMCCYTSKNQASFSMSVSHRQFLKAITSLRLS